MISIPKSIVTQYTIVPPAMAQMAPVLLAFFQNIPRTNTQKKAVSRPPKANMLIFQITSGGLMEIKNMISPSTRVQSWLSMLVFLSDILC